jgi:hypothetical protein
MNTICRTGVILGFTICFWLTGCTTYVTVMEDPYIQATVVKYEKKHKVMEGALTNERVCYTRHFKGTDRGPIVVEFEFFGMANNMTRYTGEDLDESGYFLINNSSFPIKLENRKNSKELNIHGSINGGGHMFGPFFSSSGDLSINTMTTCRLSARFTMSPEMDRALAAAEKISMRLSSGGRPLILKASGGQVEMIRALAAFTPGQKH